MTVIQISQIQLRTGRREDLPAALPENEIVTTYDTGEIFVGMPTLSKVQSRLPTMSSPGRFPYGNVKILTEFDVARTLVDHVVTTSPLQRFFSAERTLSNQAVTVNYTGPVLPVDGSGVSTIRTAVIDVFNSDESGSMLYKAEYTNASGLYNLSLDALTVIQNSSGNTSVLLDLDTAQMDTVTADDEFTFWFIPAMEIDRYPLSEADSMIINYSIKTTVPVNGKTVRRTGTLHVVADEDGAEVMDNGVDMNQQSGVNYMRVVFSVRVVEDVDPLDPSQIIKYLSFTCTNASDYPVHITYFGDRWSSDEL